MNMNICLLVAAMAIAATFAPTAPAAAAPDQEKTPASLAAPVAEAVEGIFDRAESDGDFNAALASASALFDEVIAYAPAGDADAFRGAAFAKRLLAQLSKLERDHGVELLRYLRNNRRLAEDLTFLIHPERDDPEKVFALLDRLRAARGDVLDEYASLAAAICVVHEKPLTRRINENRAAAPDPIALFDYFRVNERRMLFGIRSVPPELMIYIVDSTASIEEMLWALNRYAGDRNVGARFFDIDYDYDHFRKGEQKKVTAAGWNLPNILRFGGVCADQAYFAAAVGKAIGVPTTYTRGRSGEVSHAWTGFLQSDGRRGWWNFNTGRYAAYQGVRGVVVDPQTGRQIPDSHVSLLADFIHAKRAHRQFAEASADAVKRLMEIEVNREAWPPPAALLAASQVQRQPTTEDQLALLETGLRVCPGSLESWRTLIPLSEQGRLTLQQKKRWAGVLDRLCGKWYPDFHFEMLRPMIESIDDVEEQNRLWNAAFRTFQQRADLAAEVRMEQASMWLKAGRPERAGQCYEDVINRYANAGPFVVKALKEAEKILRRQNDARRAVAMYERAWGLTQKPKDMADIFAMQSNWFRVGLHYAELLNDAGMPQQAANVYAAIGMQRGRGGRR